MTVTILNADVIQGLAQLADESVHCVVTSPPYWGLRDYGADGQIGLEPTLAEHIDKLVSVFREVRRVLRSDGTLWLNYGDGYAGGCRGDGADGSKQRTNAGSLLPPKKITDGLKPKDLLMMPERLALALQADGWWVRARIIWHKPNPMPESVTDRPTKSHEHIWLLSKAPRYYYDAEAIKEKSETGDPRRPYGSAGVIDPRGKDAQGNGKVRREPTQAMWRNARDVWTIATAPFSEAHFATFPPELAERCIKAGTSEKGCCAECGAPWVRETVKGEPVQQHWAPGTQEKIDKAQGRHGASSVFNTGFIRPKITTGWLPSCTCNADVVPCTVLDPFFGSGTTGLVADRLQRHAIGIELNPEYAAMAWRRIERDGGLFVDIREAIPAAQRPSPRLRAGALRRTSISTRPDA